MINNINQPKIAFDRGLDTQNLTDALVRQRSRAYARSLMDNANEITIEDQEYVKSLNLVDLMITGSNQLYDYVSLNFRIKSTSELVGDYRLAIDPALEKFPIGSAERSLELPQNLKIIENLVYTTISEFPTQPQLSFVVKELASGELQITQFRLNILANKDRKTQQIILASTNEKLSLIFN